MKTKDYYLIITNLIQTQLYQPEMGSSAFCDNRYSDRIISVRLDGCTIKELKIKHLNKNLVSNESNIIPKCTVV